MLSLRGICSCLDPKAVENDDLVVGTSWCGRFISFIKSAPHSFLNIFASPPPAPSLIRKPRAFCLTSKLGVSAPQFFDPTMIRMQEFITNLTVLMGNSLYTHFVQPSIQNSGNMSQDLQAKWDTLSTAIATACASEIMAGFDDALISMDALAKGLLAWLMHSDDTSKVKSSLVDTLEEKFSDLTHDFVTSFVDSISDLNWLTGSSAVAVQAPEPGVLKTLLTAVIQKLIDDKMHAFIASACSSIQSTLLTDLPPSVTANSKIIGDEIGKRFTTLIQTTSPLNSDLSQLTLYRQGYDHIVDLFYKQTEAVISCGSDMQKFSDQDICDPAIAQMLSPPTGTSQPDYQTQVEQTLSLQFANEFLPLLLPDQRTVQNGLTVTIPGIMLLLQKLQLPPNLLTFILNFLKWPADLFPDGPPASVQTVFNSAVYFMQRAIAAIINDQIETGLGIGLNLGMNMVVPKIYLTMWMAKGAFPALFPALMKALFAVRISDAGHDLSEQFLPLASASCDRQGVYANLVPYMQNVLQDMLGKEMTFADVGITNAVFAQELTPVLDAIADSFVANAEAQANKYDRHDIAHWLADSAKPINAGTDTTYGKLLEDLIFHMGDLKALGNTKLSEFVCEHFLTNIMSKALTSSMYDLRVSEELVVGGILNGLSNIMSTQAEVDDLLWGEPNPPVDMSRELAVQLNQISCFVDIIIKTLIDQIPTGKSVGKYFEDNEAKTLKALLPSQRDQSIAFSKVFDGVLGIRYLNENLYIQTVGIIIDALKAADRQIQLQSASQ